MTSIGRANDQLVLEIMVQDIERSLAVYTALGFKIERRDGDFVELSWDDHRLFLDQRGDLPAFDGASRGNVRIMTTDVDGVWAKVQSLAIRVEREIADRYYGLRDFTVLDPDGFGLRFASVLSTSTTSHNP
jgi:catechol 2,3-dioxygenase-like lactoylglutathione lyase family enzyme